MRSLYTNNIYASQKRPPTRQPDRINSQAGNIDVDCRSSHPSFWGGNLQVSE